jgi:hypothetical protein
MQSGAYYESLGLFRAGLVESKSNKLTYLNLLNWLIALSGTFTDLKIRTIFLLSIA